MKLENHSRNRMIGDVASSPGAERDGTPALLHELVNRTEPTDRSPPC